MMKTPHVALALTMGDPAGIGPEIVLKALSSRQIPPSCRVVVVGSMPILEKARTLVPESLPLLSIDDPEKTQSNTISVLNIDKKGMNRTVLQPGTVTAPQGQIASQCIQTAISLAKQRAVGGVVTCPINKKALHCAGIPFPGHTELFAHETRTKKFSMMFMLDDVCVTHVTTHCSLREALDRINKKAVFQHIMLLHDAVCRLGHTNPTIAVAGLNPHAGEGGLFGTEEIDHIQPAIEQARSQGVKVQGPLPPDTVFMRAFKGEFKGVVSMLHDHGFVALKSRDFERGVNITLGLPFVRTSVGHGTAFDIAWKGIASSTSLVSAIHAAYRLCESE